MNIEKTFHSIISMVYFEIVLETMLCGNEYNNFK